MALNKLDGNMTDPSLVALTSDNAQRMINVKYPPAGLVAAKIDGATDDASTLKAIFDYVNSLGGGTVFIPAGTCLLGTIFDNGDGSGYNRFANLYSNMTLLGVPGKTILKAKSGLNANNFNYFVFKGASPQNITIRDIIFDYNGVNNLVPAPSSTYRSNHAISIQRDSGLGQNIEISGCKFLDNPGSNSISVVDGNPTDNVNAMENVWIHHNEFRNFGYLVGDSLNVNSADHSCIYLQARRFDVHDNVFIQDYTASEAISIGMGCVDLHSYSGKIHNNIVDNIHTMIPHEPNGHNAYDIEINDNVCTNVDRLYALFSGSGAVEGVTITNNVISPPFSNRNMPVIDLYNAIGDTLIPNNIRISGNNVVWRKGGATGKTANFLKLARGVGIQVEGNIVQNCPGDAIFLIASTNLFRITIEGNKLIGFGVGEASSNRFGIYIDNTDVGSSGSTIYIKNNHLDRGANTARDAGVYFAGAMDTLIIDGNEIIGCTKYIQCPSNAVTNFRGVRFKKYENILANTFTAPGSVPGTVSVDVTMSGVRVGDIVNAVPPSPYPTDATLVAYVSADDTIKLKWTQTTGTAAIPPNGYYSIEVISIGSEA